MTVTLHLCSMAGSSARIAGPLIKCAGRWGQRPAEAGTPAFPCSAVVPASLPRDRHAAAAYLNVQPLGPQVTPFPSGGTSPLRFMTPSSTLLKNCWGMAPSNVYSLLITK